MTGHPETCRIANLVTCFVTDLRQERVTFCPGWDTQLSVVQLAIYLCKGNPEEGKKVIWQRTCTIYTRGLCAKKRKHSMFWRWAMHAGKSLMVFIQQGDKSNPTYFSYGTMPFFRNAAHIYSLVLWWRKTLFDTFLNWNNLFAFAWNKTMPLSSALINTREMASRQMQLFSAKDEWFVAFSRQNIKKNITQSIYLKVFPFRWEMQQFEFSVCNVWGGMWGEVEKGINWQIYNFCLSVPPSCSFLQKKIPATLSLWHWRVLFRTPHFKDCSSSCK